METAFNNLYGRPLPKGFKRAAAKLVARIVRETSGRGKGGAGEVCVSFVDDKSIRKLNKKFRKIDRATDVLSFGMDEPGILGDVVISVDTAGRNARRFRVPLARELKRLVAHGLLHLMGHDHVRSAERGMMRMIEERYA